MENYNNTNDITFFNDNELEESESPVKVNVSMPGRSADLTAAIKKANNRVKAGSTAPEDLLLCEYPDLEKIVWNKVNHLCDNRSLYIVRRDMYDEMLSYCVKNILVAAKRYDASVGTTFGQYAWSDIRHAIFEFTKDFFEIKGDSFPAILDYLNAHADERPSDEEVADECGVNVWEVRCVRKRMVGLDDAKTKTYSDHRARTIEETLPDDESDGAEDISGDQFAGEVMRLFEAKTAAILVHKFVFHEDNVKIAPLVNMSDRNVKNRLDYAVKVIKDNLDNPDFGVVVEYLRNLRDKG